MKRKGKKRLLITFPPSLTMRNPTAVPNSSTYSFTNPLSVKVGRGSRAGEDIDSSSCDFYVKLLKAPAGHWGNSQDSTSALLELSGSATLPAPSPLRWVNGWERGCRDKGI